MNESEVLERIAAGWEALEAGEAERAYIVLSPVLSADSNHREALLARAMASCDAGRPTQGLDDLQRLLDIDPQNTDAWVELCRCLIAANELAHAFEELESMMVEFPDDGEMQYLMAIVLELLGKQEAADSFYSRANKLAPSTCPLPLRVSEDEVVVIAREAVDNLPEEISRFLNNVSLFIQDVPVDELLEEGDRPLPPTILGLCQGPSLRDHTTEDPWSMMPCEIFLFRRNIERMARDREDLEREIAITVLHEVGHFLGLSEEDVARLGLS